VLRCRNEEEAYAMEKKVRGLLRWNTRPLSFSESIASGYQRAKNYVEWRCKRRRVQSTRIFDQVFK